MGTNNGLMRIFWPSDAPTGPTSGVLVGFRNSELDVFVISILQEVEVRTYGIRKATQMVNVCIASSSRQCAGSRHSATPQSSRRQGAALEMWTRRSTCSG